MSVAYSRCHIQRNFGHVISRWLTSDNLRVGQDVPSLTDRSIASNATMPQTTRSKGDTAPSADRSNASAGFTAFLSLPSGFTPGVRRSAIPTHSQ